MIYINKHRDMPVFTEFRIQLLGCVLKLRFKRNKYPFIYSYLISKSNNRNGCNVNMMLDEFSELLLDVEGERNNHGIYTGMDFLNYLNAKICRR